MVYYKGGDWEYFCKEIGKEADMLDTIFGALIGIALASDGGITVKTVDLHEKAQIDKVLEIANTISLKMMETIAEDIEDVAEPGPGEELLIQITY